MPAIQTSYPNAIAPAKPGQIADERTARIGSKVAQINSVPFGAPLFRGTIDNGAMIAGTAGAGAFAGVAVIAPEVRPLGSTPDTYQAGDIMAVLESGPIWVTTATATAPGNPVYYDANGNWTATASGNTAAADSVFSTTTAAGGLARIFVRVG